MPNLGPTYDLAARLHNLEVQVRQLCANQIGQAFSATQSDGSVGLQVVQSTTGSGGTAMVFFQGPNTPRDPNTGYHPMLLFVGQLWENGQPEDAGLLCARESGKYYFSAEPANGFAVYDAAGNVVFAPDEVSGQGVARPYLPIPLPVATAYTSWPHTSSSGTIAESEFPGQNPKLTWTGLAIADAGTTGTVQVNVVDAATGTKVLSGASYSVGSSGYTSISDAVGPLPSPFLDRTFAVQVTASASGGGNVYAQLLTVFGTQS